MSDDKPIMSNDDQILKEAENFMTSVITSSLIIKMRDFKFHFGA